ncbi:riboflavin synthase subunit alpha [Nitzschia inconspicua]|uniref:Riboflavin synthase n=1 Tax=Nitzschia inconspicua TaxID=303405 RepID=A0A9K3KKE8_9STRA|nr:riboflavin synthase subunit alpha [Nitzschia inconspicua]
MAFAPPSPTIRMASANHAVYHRMMVPPLTMFTGIVEEMGVVQALVERDDMVLWDGSTGRGTELTVRGNVVLDGAYLGCSICVSGVCLTATALDPIQKTFKVGLAPETLRKTYFSSLRPGQAVNLERASEIGGRNSGHFVQGHVDGTGTIVRKQPDQDSLAITIQVDNPDLIKYIVPKGFIAIDGTSLTVVDVDTVAKTFSFMLIEYTQKKIIIPQKQVGDKVNLEVDVLGKYSETALAALIPRLEALEAKVESLERALAGSVVSSSTPSMSQQQPQQQPQPPSPTSDSTIRAGGTMVPPKTYRPPPKSTAIGPMGGVPRATSSYIQNEAEEFRRTGSSMTRPVISQQQQEEAVRSAPTTTTTTTTSPQAVASTTGTNGSYLNQLEKQQGNSSNNDTTPQTSQPQTSQPQQAQQPSKSVTLNPEPPAAVAAAAAAQRRRFTSVPTGKGVPNTAHSQESLPDPLL